MKEFVSSLYHKYKPQGVFYKILKEITLPKLTISVGILSTLSAVMIFFKSSHILGAVLGFMISFGILMTLVSLMVLITDSLIDNIESKAKNNLFNFLKENQEQFKEELFKLKLIGYQNLNKDYVLDDETLHATLIAIEDNEVDESWLREISSKITHDIDYYFKTYEKYLSYSKEQSVEEIKQHIVQILHKEQEFQNKKQNLINDYLPQSSGNEGIVFKKNKSLTMNL